MSALPSPSATPLYPIGDNPPERRVRVTFLNQSLLSGN
jgi:hypothetical protein